MHDPWTLFRARALAVLIPALVAAAVYHWWPEIEGRALLISLSEQEERARLEAARRDMWFGDFEAARATLEPMAYGGLTQAQSYLGRVLVDGRNSLADVELGYAWLRLAAEESDSIANIEIAFLKAAGGQSQAEKEDALATINRFADRGEPYALSTLALMYRGGLGVPKNYVRAADFALEASLTGHPNAAYHLLTMFLSNDLPPSERQVGLLADRWLALWNATGDLLVLKTLRQPSVFARLNDSQKEELSKIVTNTTNQKRLEFDEVFWKEFAWRETAGSALATRDERSINAIARLWYATQLAMDQTTGWENWRDFNDDFVFANNLSDRRLIAKGQSLAASWLSGERLYPIGLE